MNKFTRIRLISERINLLGRYGPKPIIEQYLLRRKLDKINQICMNQIARSFDVHENTFIEYNKYLDYQTMNGGLISCKFKLNIEDLIDEDLTSLEKELNIEYKEEGLDYGNFQILGRKNTSI